MSKTKGRNRLPNSALYCFKLLSQAAPGSLAEHRARLNLDAWSHGRGNRDALDVGALGAGGLGLGDGIRERLDVLHQLLFRERRLADACLHDSRLLDAELDRAALGALDG